MPQKWNSRQLFEQLLTSPLAQQGAVIEIGPESNAFISVVMPEFGDLPIHVSVTGEQIFVSAPICTGENVKDHARFNDACLRLNPLNTLSNIGITRNGDVDVYLMFGELSASSSFENVLEEIETLGHNTIEAARLLQAEMN